MAALISIDGVDLPSPTLYSLQNFDLDSGEAKRNEEGYLLRDRVRQGIYKIELEWLNITSSELALIKAAIEPAKVNVKFITESGYVTKEMYVGDRQIKMSLYNPIPDKILWNISFNLTEY